MSLLIADSFFSCFSFHLLWLFCYSEVIADRSVVKIDAKPEEVDDQDQTGASGLERIRGFDLKN